MASAFGADGGRPHCCGMNELCPMPGCRVERIAREASDLLHVAARGTRPGGRCPDCGQASRAVHSRYQRRPADLPSLGSRVRVGLVVRRFYCRNPGCARRTFAERLPELVAPRARRTLRLAEAQGRLGAVLGGEPSARLLPRLAMPASPDTVLRLVRTMPLPEAEPPRVVVVDDWAMRKGHTYGTIVVDLERRRVVDLLPNRAAETLADWLRRHSGIEIVARDRSTEYARGIALGAPEAVQVCDRWHLLANVRQAVERWLARVHARLRDLPVPPDGDGRCPDRRTSASRPSAAEAAARADSRARRLAAYEGVRQRHLAGETLRAIGRATGLARATVRKYACAESFPERAIRRPGRSELDPYLAHLEARLAQGCEDAMALWREVRARGYAGGRKMVQRWVAARRTKPAPRTARKLLREAPAGSPSGAASDPSTALPSPKQLAWLLVQPVAALSPSDAAVVGRVEQDGEAALVASLARRFTALVRRCGVGQSTRPAAPSADLDAWLAEARACGIGAIETFAAGLEQDGAAVRAALTEPWSSGQAEGQVNRLKLLKRQSYGRAAFDLLRRRVLLAA
jgi:transposase